MRVAGQWNERRVSQRCREPASKRVRNGAVGAPVYDRGRHLDVRNVGGDVDAVGELQQPRRGLRVCGLPLQTRETLLAVLRFVPEEDLRQQP